MSSNNSFLQFLFLLSYNFKHVEVRKMFWINNFGFLEMTAKTHTRKPCYKGIHSYEFWCFLHTQEQVRIITIAMCVRSRKFIFRFYKLNYSETWETTNTHLYKSLMMLQLKCNNLKRSVHTVPLKKHYSSMYLVDKLTNEM